MQTCKYCGTEYGVVQGTNGALPPFALHNADECRKKMLALNTNLVLAMLPAARLVYEQGGWSGTSGNWPLVEAFGKLETLKELAPEVYAKLIERNPAKKFTDEPCTLCNGTGKRPDKSMEELEVRAFISGKDVAEFLFNKQLARQQAAIKDYLALCDDDFEGINTTDAMGMMQAAQDKLRASILDQPDPCKCPEIQAKDPRRHFKGCPERKELEEPVCHGCDLQTSGMQHDATCPVTTGKSGG